MQNKVSNIFCGILLCVVGFFVITSGNTAGKEQKEFNKNAKKTTATVSDVQKETVRERYKRNGRTKYRTKTRYIAYLNYEVNGVSYSNVELSSGASNLSEGRSVVIYYNSKKPREIALNLSDPGTVKTSMTLVGLVFLVPGAWILFKAIKEIQNS